MYPVAAFTIKASLMKIITLLLFACPSVMLSAQNDLPRTRVITHRYDSSTVIHDSAGSILPYHEWSDLLGSADYIISTKQDSAGREYNQLKWLSPAERKRMASMSIPDESPNFPKGKIWPLTDGEFSDDSIKAFKGKPLLVHLTTFSHFPAAELAKYKTLMDSMPAEGKIGFVILSPDDFKNVERQMEDWELDFPYHFIFNKILLDKYGVNRYPQDILLDGEGKVFYSSVGFGTSTIYWLDKAIRMVVKSEKL